MERYIFGIAIAVAVGVSVYVIINHMEWVVRGLCRGLLLTAALIAARLLLSDNQIVMQIGVNPLSVGVLTFLGIPGAVLLFGVQTFLYICH